MDITNDVEIGSILELKIKPDELVFINNDIDTISLLKKSLNACGVCHSENYVVKEFDDNTINGLDKQNWFPISINNNEWLNKIKAIPVNENIIKIGQLNFKRTVFGLIVCDDNFEPLKKEKLIIYLHQLQKIYHQIIGSFLNVPI